MSELRSVVHEGAFSKMPKDQQLWPDFFRFLKNSLFWVDCCFIRWICRKLGKEEVGRLFQEFECLQGPVDCI